MKIAANDDMKTDIQCRLEEAEGKILEGKKLVTEYEQQINQEESKLKKGGEFTVFQSLTVKSYSTY